MSDINADLDHAKILALRGKKSMGLIAKEFGITRNVVAGIFFRDAHPGQRSTGTGRRNEGTRAATCLRAPGGKAGRIMVQGIRRALEQIADLCRHQRHSDIRNFRKECLDIAESAIAHADKSRNKMRARSQRHREFAERAS